LAHWLLLLWETFTLILFLWRLFVFDMRPYGTVGVDGRSDGRTGKTCIAAQYDDLTITRT